MAALRTVTVSILARMALEKVAEVSTIISVLAHTEQHGITAVVTAMGARMAAGGTTAMEGKVGATRAGQTTTTRQVVMLLLHPPAGGEMRLVHEDMRAVAVTLLLSIHLGTVMLQL